MHYTSNELTVLFCPKCDREDVKIVPVNVSVKRKSMDALKEYDDGYVISHSIIRYYLYRAVCCYCGYSVEYEKTN